ncbi:hypothetical protein FDI21_gp179 [Pseudomonas phage Noxifer]|uniref:Uncharacterized protein n=1 Tax=Pseudomonas phage Noxifer TaxID=2006684 RepID=A0A1Y0T1D9_9CAUD|nr:hypothetical protein FDI21_gp179 [Pseudomonas phage Noxifer]ARV77348.1 hypothetical protein NOXIFER_179 [Pseudomonas phage Noxifer]
MLKEIGKAILMRAVSVLIAIALVAAYANFKESMKQRRKLALDAAKASNKVSQLTGVQLMEQLLKELSAEVEAQLATYETATAEVKSKMKTDLMVFWAARGSKIDNGSIRDIYLTTVNNIANTAFPEKA